jgi:hypothetical protein
MLFPGALTLGQLPPCASVFFHATKKEKKKARMK